MVHLRLVAHRHHQTVGQVAQGELFRHSWRQAQLLVAAAEAVRSEVVVLVVLAVLAVVAQVIVGQAEHGLTVLSIRVVAQAVQLIAGQAVLVALASCTLDLGPKSWHISQR